MNLKTTLGGLLIHKTLAYGVGPSNIPGNNLNILSGLGLCDGKVRDIRSIWRNRDLCFDPFEESRVLCGSDGHTYLTNWEFETGRCLNPGLSIYAEGPCDCHLAEITCEALNQPVCGDNAFLYRNMCQLKEAICERDAQFAYGFPPPGCFDDGRECCSPERLRLTDGDLRTLPVDAISCLRPASKCDSSWLEMAKCIYFSSGGQIGAKMLTECGALQNNKCNAKCKPVCGNDFVMYANNCVFQWARSLDRGLLEMDCSAISQGSPLWKEKDVTNPDGYWPDYSGPGSGGWNRGDIKFCESGCRIYFDGCNVCWCSVEGLQTKCTDEKCSITGEVSCLESYHDEETPFIDFVESIDSIWSAIQKARGKL